MAIVPSARGPGYGREASQTAAAFDANAAQRLGSVLDANAESLGHILSNSERIAGIAGSGALDRLLNAYANSQQPMFGGEYAGMMDRLRMQMGQAQLAATNRSNRGGGGGSKSKTLTPDGNDVWVRMPSGEITFMDAGKYDDMVSGITMSGNEDSFNNLPVVLGPGTLPRESFGAPTTGGAGGNPAGVQTNPTVNMQDNVTGTGGPRSNGDGTWTLSNGTVVDGEGNVVK